MVSFTWCGFGLFPIVVGADVQLSRPFAWAVTTMSFVALTVKVDDRLAFGGAVPSAISRASVPWPILTDTACAIGYGFWIEVFTLTGVQAAVTNSVPKSIILCVGRPLIALPPLSRPLVDSPVCGGQLLLAVHQFV